MTCTKFPQESDSFAGCLAKYLMFLYYYIGLSLCLLLLYMTTLVHDMMIIRDCM